MDLSTGKPIHETRARLVRNAPVPIGRAPICQARKNAGDRAEELSWELMRDALIEHGSIYDADDEAPFAEFRTLGELTARAWKPGGRSEFLAGTMIMQDTAVPSAPEIGRPFRLNSSRLPLRQSQTKTINSGTNGSVISRRGSKG